MGKTWAAWTPSSPLRFKAKETPPLIPQILPVSPFRWWPQVCRGWGGVHLEGSVGRRAGGGHPLVAAQCRASPRVNGEASAQASPVLPDPGLDGTPWADTGQNLLTQLGTGTRACKEAVSFTSVLRKRMGPRILISGCQIINPGKPQHA